MSIAKLMRADESPAFPARACLRRLFQCLLAGCLSLAAFSVRAQIAGGVVKGGFTIFEFDEATNRKKSMLTGDEARSIGGDTWQVSRLRIESYDDSEQVTWIVESPECFYDKATKRARSTNALAARSTTGQFTLSGTGFEWRPAEQKLYLSNAVRLIVHGGGPGRTNLPAGLARNDVQIESDRFDFDVKKTDALFMGNVRARELLKPGDTNAPLTLKCELLQALLERGKGLQYLQAEQDVILEQGPNMARAGKAVYRVTNEVVEMTGQAVWTTAEAEGKGDLLIYERRANRFRAEGNTYTKLQPQTRGPSRAPAPAATNEIIEIFAGTLTALLPQTNRPQALINAEQQVVILRGDVRATADAATYTGTGSNGVLLLTGQASWKTPQAEGSAAKIAFSRQLNEFQAEGKARFKLWRAAGPPNAPQPAERSAIEIESEEYDFKEGIARFRGPVRMRDPQWKLACDDLVLHTAGQNRRLQRMIAEKNVLVSPAQVPPGQPGWELACARLELLMQPGESAPRLEKIIAEQDIKLAQTPASGKTQEPLWRLEAGRLVLITDPQASDVIRNVQAAKDVRLVQVSTNGADLLWQITSGLLTANLAAPNRLENAEAEQNVIIHQPASTSGPPARLYCESARLAFNNSNQVQRMEAERHVLLEQGSSRAAGHRMVFDNASAQVQLQGQPWLDYVESKTGASNRPPQRIKVENAEALHWNRASNQFRGNGPFRLVVINAATPQGSSRATKPR